MTFAIKIRGGGPMVAEYECPVHGRFSLTVDRDAKGDPPTVAPCPVGEDIEHHCESPPCSDCGYTFWQCVQTAEWRISAPLGRVALAGFNRGKSEAPPTKHALTTRDLAEGMPVSEWKAKRKALARERRHAHIKKMMG